MALKYRLINLFSQAVEGRGLYLLRKQHDFANGIVLRHASKYHEIDRVQNGFYVERVDMKFLQCRRGRTVNILLGGQATFSTFFFRSSSSFSSHCSSLRANDSSSCSNSSSHVLFPPLVLIVNQIPARCGYSKGKGRGYVGSLGTPRTECSFDHLYITSLSSTACFTLSGAHLV